jgi:uncharacterized protein YxjI
MEYVMASRWSVMERFEITDTAGTPQFEARGHLASRITLHDSNGQEVADIRKHLTARGRFDGGDYTVSRDGAPIAQMVRKFSLREKFAVDVADGEKQAFLLALVLAIEAIHDERRQQHGSGLGVGLAGGGIAGMIARDVL